MGQGQSTEQNVATWFDTAGYSVMRAGASGGGVTRDQPDIFAGKVDERIAGEAKYSGDSRKYLDRKEILCLIRFAWNFEAVPVIILRWKGQRTFWVYRIQDLHETRGESLRADKDDRQNSLRGDGWPWPLSNGGRGVTTSAMMHGQQSNTLHTLCSTDSDTMYPKGAPTMAAAEEAARIWDLDPDPLSREWDKVIRDD